MDRAELYDRLAAYLDQGIVGAPKSPALLEILKVLFPPEEAEIALNVPMYTTSLSRLQEIFTDKPDIKEILERMVGRGTLFTKQKSERERVYRLMPSVVGWAETPYWAGKDTPEARKLAPLWVRYREEAFAEELARGVPVMRVLPVSRTVRDPREVLPFDEIQPMIENTTYRAVGLCPCRQIKRYIGEGCDHSLENCLHFGTMGKYMVDHDMARNITVKETLLILEAANREGLVHTVNNIQDFLTTICNCCGCCCSFIDTKRRYGVHTISSSNYVSRIDKNACVGCGICVDRCPMEALTQKEAGIVSVDESVCIGCGVCTPTCEAGAIDLVLRGDVIPPPMIDEVMAARYKKFEKRTDIEVTAKMDAKQRILKAGARIILRKGFNDTGLQEVLDAAKVPKGSFYFYFRNKEDFGLQVIDYFADYYLRKADECAAAGNGKNIDKIRRYLDWQAESLEANGFKGGCPFGILAQEMADRSDAFRKKLNEVFEKLRAKLIKDLEGAQNAGEIDAGLDIFEVADFMLNSWQGVLLQMKVVRSTTPRRAFDEMVFMKLLNVS